MINLFRWPVKAKKYEYIFCLTSLVVSIVWALRIFHPYRMSSDVQSADFVSSAIFTQDEGVETVENSDSIFKEGTHLAQFTVSTMSGDQRERIEEIVLTRGNHVRHGETVGLVETGEHIVINQRFHVLHSVQALIAQLKAASIPTELKITWDDDVTAPKA